MARYIPGMNGPLVGSVGSITYSKNSFGYYVKTKPIPTNPNTAKQAAQRQFLKEIVAYWKTTLTAAQAAAWTHAAELHKRSKYGFGFNLSGINLFVAYNALVLKAGGAILAEPTIFTGAVGSVLPTISEDATGKLEISAWGNTEAHIWMFVYCSNAVPVSTSYKNCPYVTDEIGESTTGWPKLLDVAYPGSNDDTYRCFVGIRFFDDRGAVSELIRTDYSGTRIIV